MSANALLETGLALGRPGILRFRKLPYFDSTFFSGLASAPSSELLLSEDEVESADDSAVASSELVDLIPAPPQPARKVIIKNTMR